MACATPLTPALIRPSDEVTMWTDYGQPIDVTLPVAALMQGQGFENVGDESLFWYTPWPEHVSDGIRVATWIRDRLGYFAPFAMLPLSRIKGAR